MFSKKFALSIVFKVAILFVISCHGQIRPDSDFVDPNAPNITDVELPTREGNCIIDGYFRF